MIEWQTASPALLKLFTRLAYDNPPKGFAAQWGDRTQRYTDSTTRTDLRLTVRSIEAIGVDETSQVTVNGEQHYAQLGDRIINIECRVETYRNMDPHWAWSTIERIRSRIRRPSSLELLRDINWALIRIGPTVQLPMHVRGAEWSAASFEVAFGARFLDVEPEAFDWIERIEITSHFKDTGGDELPVPPNVTQELIPEA